MILEQRYGAAQVAVQATEVLHRRAAAGQAASPDTFRREMFRTGWQLISAGRATGSLVNLVNTMLWALEGCDTPADLRNAVDSAIAHFRHQLNQRVIDTAIQGLSVLVPTQRVLIYGYSTTVQYTLQHALRNGHRIDVACLQQSDNAEHYELIARISAIGLTVDTLTSDRMSADIHDFDAVIVGADTLDQHGLVNRTGTHAIAQIAHQHGVPFFSFCTSEKLLADVFYTGRIHADILDASPSVSVADLTANDRTPLHLITGVITERGPLTAPAIEAWLAAETLHPWLAGIGTIMPTVET